MAMLMTPLTKKNWIFQNAVVYQMVCHYRAWRHTAPWLKISYLHAWWDNSVQSPCCCAFVPSSFLSPAERGSHPALPEGRPPLVRYRNLFGGSKLRFRSKFAKGWPQIPSSAPHRYSFYEIYPSERKGCICKRLQCLQHKIIASDFYGNQALVNVILRDNEIHI